MIVIDTNVVSEAMKPAPDDAVIAWFNSQAWDSLFLCTPVLAELHQGVEQLAAGRRKRTLTEALDRIENELYRGRILSFDQSAAAAYGRLTALANRQGRRMGQMDALIAATALTHGAAIATRDTDGFAGIRIELVNPFHSR